MKIIISHDVDHITASEHFKSALMPKFIVKSNIEFVLGKISFREFTNRFSSIINNKWNNISELIDFDQKNNIPSTFFVGVNNGLGLNYSLELANKWISEIIGRGVSCGVHGIAYKSFEDIKKEYDTFKSISGLESFGVRTHYLRTNGNTLEHFAKAGYVFDSSDYGLNKHYRVDGLHEFPLHVMETYEMEAGKKWQSVSTEQAIESTIDKMKTAEKNGVEYFTLLFHDRYFDDSFVSWQNWYKNITQYCVSQGYEFIDFNTAVREIDTVL